MHRMRLLTVLRIDVGILCEYFSYKLMLLVMRNFGSRVFFLISSDPFRPDDREVKTQKIILKTVFKEENFKRKHLKSKKSFQIQK